VDWRNPGELQNRSSDLRNSGEMAGTAGDHRKRDVNTLHPAPQEDHSDGILRRREHLRELLDAHVPADEIEATHLRRMRELLENDDDPFSRSHFHPGHFTASAFVLDPEQRRLVFIHHLQLQRWLQPGGHVDPTDQDVLAAARREVKEECGLVDLRLVGEGLLDVDVHRIPARAAGKDRLAEPSHEHFDLRFVFHSRKTRLRPASDAVDARWIPFDEVDRLGAGESLRRAVRKLKERPWRYPHYWRAQFVDGHYPWELGEPSPTLLELAQDHLPHPERGETPARVLVPGCGRGDDALALARLGHRVCALDWSATALRELTARAEEEGLTVEIHEGSAFDLPASFLGAFDAWAEHTFFCAVDPDERARYAVAAARALRPGGLLLGAVFLGENPPQGSSYAANRPPWLTPRGEFEALFARDFEIVALWPSAVAPARRSKVEWGAVLRKKG